MSALDWRRKMTEAPRLVHESNGLVLIQLGEHSVLFPKEADARFFHGAYADVPNLAAEVAHLRAISDEAALLTARAMVAELEVEVARLTRERDEAAAQAATQAERAAGAARRAKVLARALQRRDTP